MKSMECLVEQLLEPDFLCFAAAFGVESSTVVSFVVSFREHEARSKSVQVDDTLLRASQSHRPATFAELAASGVWPYGMKRANIHIPATKSNSSVSTPRDADPSGTATPAGEPVSDGVGSIPQKGSFEAGSNVSHQGVTGGESAAISSQESFVDDVFLAFEIEIGLTCSPIKSEASDYNPFLKNLPVGGF